MPSQESSDISTSEFSETSHENSQYKSSSKIAVSKISESKATESSKTSTSNSETIKQILETGKYSTKDDVSKYISIYGKLPSNFITKNNAEKLDWKSSEDNLWTVTDKMSIGGDVFGNYEGLLPSKNGRIYYECDINYKGGSRNAERIVYSNDGLIYYTSNHYETFTQLK